MLNISLYWVFLAVAVPTILSPGPGVLMSLTNSMRYGLKGATPGILGVATSTWIVGLVSMTGLGVVIASSPTVYAVIRFLGILYLFYLGWKKWKAKPFAFNMAWIELKEGGIPDKPSAARLFGEGILLQFTNPALIIFYLSLFPQCIDPALSYWAQVLILTFNYFLLVWIIHSGYGFLGAMAADKFLKPEAAVWINRISAAAYWLLGGFFLWQFAM